MVNPNRFYTYAYLREDKTPYYIGKGQGKRVYSRQKNIKPPKDNSRIILLKQNLTEEEAFRHEKYIIFVFGRKDLGTGILHNRTNGGEGISGFTHNKETRIRMSESKKGDNNPNYKKPLPKDTRRRMSEGRKGEKNHASKLWKITKNTGEEILTWGLCGWGKENNYHQNGLYSVYTGKYKKHKDVIKVEVMSEDTYQTGT